MNKAVRTLTGAGTATAVAALLAAGLTACGDSGGDRGGAAGDGRGANAARPEEATPADVVKAAYLKTVAARFAKADVTVVDGGKSRQMQGTKGWYPAATEMTVVGSGAGSTVMIGDVVYSRPGVPVPGETWMKLDLAKGGKGRSRINDDPAEYLGLLLGQQKLTFVGAEPIDGTGTRHYKASLTNADLLRADESSKVMEEANRTYLHEAMKDVAGQELDVWIDAQGHPVRVETSRTEAKGGTAKVSAKFSEYGTVAPVVAPPADQVTTYEDMLKGADASLEGADRTLRGAGLGGLKGS
ncbi:hypothetical protein ACFWBC_14805 [Streptomyces sp. NPDC059985]|uniref:hypothetical protein n=1 Tax=Streptomyces sp. NPDC059985 TaxID=3347025 RepID=UPI00368580A1